MNRRHCGNPSCGHPIDRHDDDEDICLDPRCDCEYPIIVDDPRPRFWVGALIGFTLALLLVLFLAPTCRAAEVPLGDLPAYGALLRTATVPVSIEPTKPTTDGWTDYRRIVISDRLTPEARVCVLAHELTHVALGENEADAYYVGTSVCRALGYDVTSQWWGGVLATRRGAHVTQDGRELAATLTTIVTL